ncbi:LOG family protein [Lysobacter humi (ex Lee et al. 2017)]
MKYVCVYCGSNSGNRPVYAERAAALGRLLAEQGLGLVYGGGNVGLMGIVADAVLEAGGDVIGVIPEQLVGMEVAHRGLTKLEIVADMHTRKARMFDLADAFVALPGGFGTLDEMFEMLTWRQLGLGDKPCAFLDVEGFWAPLMAMLDHMVGERFLHPDQRADLWHGDDAGAMLAWMRDYEPAHAQKWLEDKLRREGRR